MTKNEIKFSDAILFLVYAINPPKPLDLNIIKQCVSIVHLLVYKYSGLERLIDRINGL